jgi:nucleoside-diphosphate-sugar epimerase
VLLFGATGFLGRYVRDALAGDTTLVCPRRSACDLRRVGLAALTELVRASRPDAVVNCTGLLDGTRDDLVAANTMVTATLIDAVAAGAPGARFVRIGSAGEYGPVPTGHAVAEEDVPRPVSDYGRSHLAGTRLVETACAAGRIDGAVLRVFNPVGPGMPAANVLGRTVLLLEKALAARAGQLTLGPLDACRDFIDVRDVAAAVRAVVDASHLPERVFNIGSGRAVRIRDAVALLAGAAGFTGGIRESAPAAGAARTATVAWMCADTSRAARLLGWSPADELAVCVKAAWDERADARTWEV